MQVLTSGQVDWLIGRTLMLGHLGVLSCLGTLGCLGVLGPLDTGLDIVSYLCDIFSYM